MTRPLPLPVLAAVALLAGAAGALSFGFTLEWDLLNYQLYNPHALLTGRGAIDIAPAQLQTFLNPALHLPVYLLFRYAGPAVLIALVGAAQAAQAVLLYLVADEVTNGRFRKGPALLLVAALGLGGPIFLNQLGSSQGDTLVSALVLGGLLIVLRETCRARGDRTLRAALAAGLLLGLAIALKLTFASYAIGLGVAALIVFSGARRWKMAAGLVAGGVAGLLLIGGPWYVHQWTEWGNPLLPYFNNLFQSPWVGPSSYRDLRFMPSGAVEWIFYPFVWFMDPQQVWEYRFRDIRVPLALLAVFLLPLFGWRRLRANQPALLLVCLFLAVSYLLWLKVFSIYRYLSVLELLAPVVLFAAAVLLTKKRGQLLACIVFLGLTQFAVKYVRPPSSDQFSYDTPNALAALDPGAMVVIDGYAPVGYHALWLDDRVPLIRIRSNFMSDPEPRYRLHRLADQRVREHAGPLYLLQHESDAKAEFRAPDLARVGLALPDPADCHPAVESEELQQQLGAWLCPLERLKAPES